MEVSGRRKLQHLLSRTLQLGSEEDTGLYCRPCEFSGQCVQASGYCQNCREHLCSQCISRHKKATPSRDHVVNKSSQPVAASIASDTLPSCTTHQNEEVKLYCRAHGKRGCVICMTLSHKQCEIDYIPEISEKFLKSEEYLTFEICIHDLKETCALNIRKIETGILNTEENFSNLISTVKQTKEELTKSLDEFEKELKEAAGEYRKKNIDKMESLKREHEAVVREIAETEAAANRLKNCKQFNSLFCVIKQAKTKEYQSRTYELATKYCIQECKFQKSPALSKEQLFGLIEMSDMELGPCNSPEEVIRQPIGKINIRADTDKKTCYATGLAFLSADQLAIVDKANKNVKIVDVAYDKMIDEIALSSSPRDITAIPPDQLAVTLRDEKIIQLLSTESRLTKLERIKTDENCRGIQYYDNKLIVTFDNISSPEIQILNLRGEVLHRFHYNQKGKLIVYDPKSLALSPDLSQIYVTDMMQRSILRLSQLGDITAVYKWSDFMGVVVSSGGSVYACSKSTDEVLQFADDLSYAKVVLNGYDGLNVPIALAFSMANNCLYVSCGKGDEKLLAFKLKLDA